MLICAVVSFLHANYTDFIGDEQTDDMAAAAEYLSEAGELVKAITQ
jgi:hypothetical protein